MSSRRRPLAVRVALLAVVLSFASVGEARAGTTDLTWALGQTTTSYPSAFTITSGGSAVDYRWLDTLTKDTVISANSCDTLAAYGSGVFPAGSTSYQRLFNGFGGQCFVVRGRVASGQGATTTRTGRISR